MFHFLLNRLSHQETGLFDSPLSDRQCSLYCWGAGLSWQQPTGFEHIMNTWRKADRSSKELCNHAYPATTVAGDSLSSRGLCSRGPEWALASWLHLAKQALLNSGWPCSPAALSTQAREGLCPPETQQRTCDWWHVRLMIDSYSKVGGWYNWKMCFDWSRLQLQICRPHPPPLALFWLDDRQLSIFPVILGYFPVLQCSTNTRLVTNGPS